MIFGKKKRDPTAPSSKQPHGKSTDKKKDFVTSQQSNSGSAGGVGGTGGLDESLLSDLSPTSYARQFEVLDQVVAAASSTLVNNSRSGSLPQSSATGGGGGGGQNISTDNMTVIRGVDGRESSLVKEIEGLKLESLKDDDADNATTFFCKKKTNSQYSNKNVLEFDNDSDGVFEDDDGSGTRTPSEIAAELTGGSKSNWKAGWKKKTRGKNKKSPFGVGRSSLGENPHSSGTRGDFGPDSSVGSSDDASANSRHSNSSSVRKNSRSSSSSSDESGGGGRGRGHIGGAATLSSSSSSSMGDAYENVSLDTTESEGKDVMTSGNRITAGISVGVEINKKSSKKGKREEEGLSLSTAGVKKLGTGCGHGSDSAEDYTDDEDEGEDGYKQGGYHRVKIGEVYNQR